MKHLLQWAVTSSALILIVLAVRALFRNKLSARLKYALWGVVLLRLLVPFQVELPADTSANLPLLASNFASELPTALERPLSPDTAAASTRIPADRVEANNPNGDPAFSFTAADLRVFDLENGDLYVYQGGFTLGDMAVVLWLTGVVLAALVILLSNLRFALRLKKRRRLLADVDAPIPVYEAEGLPSPCLFGVFKPAVYVTPQAAEDPDTLRHVLAHELTHYAHKDHLWSLLRCFSLALHWYNPLVWLAVVLSKGDGELACDEGAVARLGEAERIPYGRTLVDMVAARSPRPGDLLSSSTAMSGGEKSIKRRVKQIVKKPETVKIAVFAVVALVALAVVFVFVGRTDASVPNIPVPEDNVSQTDGTSFSDLAPGEEWVREQTFIVPENVSSISYSLTYDSPVPTLVFGLRAADGTEYSHEVYGGVAHGTFTDIPAGTYQIFVRNMGDPNDPDSSVGDNATGAVNFQIIEEWATLHVEPNEDEGATSHILTPQWEQENDVPQPKEPERVHPITGPKEELPPESENPVTGAASSEQISPESESQTEPERVHPVTGN